MILDATTSLQVVQSAAKTTNDMDIHVDYVDWNSNGMPTPPATYRTTSDGSTDVTILPAPVESPKREPVRISIYNRDTADKVLTLKTDNGSAERLIWRGTITTLKANLWEKGSQWLFNV